MRRFQKRQSTGGKLESWLRLTVILAASPTRPGGTFGHHAAKVAKNQARRAAV